MWPFYKGEHRASRRQRARIKGFKRATPEWWRHSIPDKIIGKRK